MPDDDDSAKMRGRARKQLADATLAQIRFEIETDQLVDVGDLESTLDEHFANLAKALDQLTDYDLLAAGVPASTVHAVKQWVDERRRTFIDQCDRVFADDEPQPAAAAE